MKPHTTMAKETATTPHVLLVSFPGQGHINPLLRFAKRIASKGLLVTFSSTHHIGQKICASTKTTPGTLNPIGEGHLRFEFFSDGWDDAADNDPRRRGDNIDALLAQLSTVASVRFVELIRRQAEEGRPVTCVIGNPFMPWALDVAEELNIPSALLWVQSSAVFSIYYHYFHSTVEFPADHGSNVSVDLPSLPTLKVDDLPSFLLDSNPYKMLASVILSQFANIDKATWVFANSFEELEHDTIQAISKLSPIIPIGPLVETGKSENVKGDIWKAEEYCMEWLDKQEPRSVVYVSVGSVVVLSRDEMTEMGFGLKNSGRAFLWVVRKDCRDQLLEGFAEDVKGRGMVVAWSPQDKVLTHGAIACFATHCGWNSTLELLTAGVPVITYPQWGDQLTDAKFLVDVYKVGARLKAPVEREEFARCIEEVTRGEKTEEVRGRCSALKEAAARAVAEGGSSDRNIQAFVDDVRRRVCGSKLEHD